MNNFFPSKKHYPNQLIANMIIKIKTVVKENIFLKKKKKIVVVINNTLICKYYIIKFIVTLASLAQ